MNFNTDYTVWTNPEGTMVGVDVNGATVFTMTVHGPTHRQYASILAESLRVLCQAVSINARNNERVSIRFTAMDIN